MSSFAAAFWTDGPQCPYCGSRKVSHYQSSERFQCYSCFTAFTSTTGTIAHRTHLDFSVWVAAVSLVAGNPSISIRQLARNLDVSNKTASRLKRILTSASTANRLQMNSILLKGSTNDS